MACLFLVLLLCLQIAMGTLSAVSNASPVSTPSLALHRNQLALLRSRGKLSLSQSRYPDALKYYSAIMQLIEGVSGEEAFELRRRCCLTLAECELRLGEYDRAIARCTEVIQESSNYLENTTDLPTTAPITHESVSSGLVDIQKTLFRAHFRRAQTFKKLGKPAFALLDLLEALKHQVGDTRCQKEVEALRAKLGRAGSAQALQQGSLLHDFAENCVVLHPRKQLSPSILRALTATAPGPVSSSPVRLSAHSPPDTRPVGGLLGLDSLFGGTGRGQSKQVAGMLQALLGWGPAKAQRVASVLVAVQVAYRRWTALRTLAIAHREAILLSATLAWLLLAWKGT